MYIICRLGSLITHFESDISHQKRYFEGTIRFEGTIWTSQEIYQQKVLVMAFQL